MHRKQTVLARFLIAVLLVSGLLLQARSFSRDRHLRPFPGVRGEKVLASKLSGPLKELVFLYRQSPRLTPQLLRNIELRRVEAKLAATGLSPQKAVNMDAPAKVFPVKASRFYPGVAPVPLKKERVLTIPFTQYAVVDPVIQKRWGNPPFDVLHCHVLVRGDTDFLKGYSLKLRSVAEKGDFRIADVEIPSFELERLARDPKVVKIYPVLRKGLKLDKSVPQTGAASLRLKSGKVFDRGYTGEGVIVGMIDTGLDWTHEDFIDPQTGETRVLYLWDTTNDTPGKTPADVFGGALSGLNYGTVWTKAEIDAGLCTAVDTDGHGTYTTGIAAGNGYTNPAYTGMAPEADLIIVKGLDENGVLFIYEVAKRLNRPAAVNMSYGYSYPIHYIALWPDSIPADGTDNASEQIEAWNSSYGGGYIPVKSAGNEGHWNTYTDLSGGSYPYTYGGYHSGDYLSASRTYIMKMPDYVQVWNDYGWGNPSSNDYPAISIGIWYDQPVQITLISPNGQTFGPYPHGVSTSDWNTDAYIEVDLDNSQAPNGSYYGTIWIEWGTDSGPYAYCPAPGDWQIIVEPLAGAGYFDMWAADFDVYYWSLYIFPEGEIHVRYKGKEAHSIYAVDFCTSEGVICVGAWNTKQYWDSKDGNTYTLVKFPWLGEIADYSSPGPSRDRRVKPEIAAPGTVVMSALSKDSSADDAYIDPDGKHVIGSGTSASAPHVTGGVALMLQKYKDMGKTWPTVDQVRDFLATTARRDMHTENMERGFGYGKLNLIYLNEPPVAKIRVPKTEVVLDNRESLELDGSDSYDYEKFPLTYRWEIVSKPAGANPVLNASGSKAVFTPDPKVEGVYMIALTVSDGIFTSKPAMVSITAKFYPVYPPVSVKLERLVNDYIFYKEYVNRITWKHNPSNTVQIAEYRIYRKPKDASDSEYRLIGKVKGSETVYYDRGLKKDELYTYRITAVGVNGKESAPVVVSN